MYYSNDKQLKGTVSALNSMIRNKPRTLKDLKPKELLFINNECLREQVTLNLEDLIQMLNNYKLDFYLIKINQSLGNPRELKETIKSLQYEAFIELLSRF